jgi:hypothetical protein
VIFLSCGAEDDLGCRSLEHLEELRSVWREGMMHREIDIKKDLSVDYEHVSRRADDIKKVLRLKEDSMFRRTDHRSPECAAPSLTWPLPAEARPGKVPTCTSTYRERPGRRTIVGV